MNTMYEQLMGEIVALKSLLNDTDYKAIKFAEGEITAEEFAETKAKRAQWRNRINELEAEIEALTEDAHETDIEDADAIDEDCAECVIATQPESAEAADVSETTEE